MLIQKIRISQRNANQKVDKNRWPAATNNTETNARNTDDHARLNWQEMLQSLIHQAQMMRLARAAKLRALAGRAQAPCWPERQPASKRQQPRKLTSLSLALPKTFEIAEVVLENSFCFLFFSFDKKKNQSRRDLCPNIVEKRQKSDSIFTNSSKAKNDAICWRCQ